MFCRAEGRTEADKALDWDWSWGCLGQVRPALALHDQYETYFFHIVS
jgi:hypothetical protein